MQATQMSESGGESKCAVFPTIPTFLSRTVSGPLNLENFKKLFNTLNLKAGSFYQRSLLLSKSVCSFASLLHNGNHDLRP